MSYEPTVWKPGDKITSRRMNKLEEGLAGVETGGVYLVKNLDETVEGKALDATVGPGIRDRLTALESASSVVLEGRVDQLEDDLATTNSNVSTLSSSLATTNTNVSTLDTNIQGVASRVTTVENDISDINDAMAVPTWDSGEETITFTSDDDAQGNATSWTSVPLIESGEKHKSIFNKFTTMVKNIRYLYNMLGTTDISSIGSGTVTSALGNLNTRVGTLNDALTRKSVGSIAGGAVLEICSNICTLQFTVAEYNPSGTAIPSQYRPKFGNRCWGVVAVTNDYASTYVINVGNDGSVQMQKNGVNVTQSVSGVRGQITWAI